MKLALRVSPPSALLDSEIARSVALLALMVTCPMGLIG